jgi:hypothetical protein
VSSRDFERERHPEAHILLGLRMTCDGRIAVRRQRTPSLPAGKVLLMDHLDDHFLNASPSRSILDEELDFFDSRPAESRIAKQAWIC